MDQPLHALEEKETWRGDSLIKDGPRGGRMLAGMTVREAQNNHHCGRRDGGRGPAGAPCWGHRAHLSLDRGDLSAPGCVALKPLILGALSSPMSSCSSRAAAELAASNQAAACVVGWV